MIADPEHDQVAELLGAYALDAVDPDERRLVERHLAACPRCAAEVDGLRQVAADLALASSLDSEHPPRAVWDRIAANLKTQGSPPSQEAPSQEAPSQAAPSHGTPSHGTPSHGIAAITDLSNGPGRRPGSRRRWDGRRRAWLGGAVAGAAAAAIVGLAVGLVHAEGQVHQLQSALAGGGSQVAVRAALASPGHRVVDLRTGDGNRLAEVVVRHDGVGYVVRSTLTRLPATQTYQLWASINGRPISLGLLGRQPASGAAFSLGTSTTGARELMVTVEPAGGVPTPDRAPLATAPLSLT